MINNTYRICKAVKRRIKIFIKKRRIDIAAHREMSLPRYDGVVLFDTAINSLNMGDSIIQYYCAKVIKELFPDKQEYHIQTHKLPTESELQVLPGALYKIVCGTNLMTPHIEEQTNWKMPEDLYGYRDIITLGVGWGYYCNTVSPESIYAYNKILSKKWLHSVRDNYTEKQFVKMGINNVINTCCPTTWALTREHCMKIPHTKANRVVATITDYDRNYMLDRRMLNILLDNYNEVAVWIQGVDDMEYLEELIDINSVTIIPRSLKAYTAYLQEGNLDYVGTRLHAGIHALNLGIRSLIIAIDNRAIEIGNDIGLPTILREQIEKELVQNIRVSRSTDIHIPAEQIRLWKEQFQKDIR